MRDTGPGISPEDQERIFEEFQQVGQSALQQHEGTGLGLALAKKLVELHGGRIWVESAPERREHVYLCPARCDRPIASGACAGREQELVSLPHHGRGTVRSSCWSRTTPNRSSC